MKLRFCIICGTNKNLEHHHIIPKVRGGDDHQHNFITLCCEHHAMIHMVRPGSWTNRKKLQREGIEKAKLKGVYKGGRLKIDVEKIKELKESGYGATQIARIMGIHRDSVYRLLKKEIMVEGEFK